MKKFVSGAVIASLLATTAASPAQAQEDNVPFKVAGSIASSIGGAIAGEVVSLIFGSIFDTAQPNAVTKEEIEAIVTKGFDDAAVADIQTAAYSLNDKYRLYSWQDPFATTSVGIPELLSAASDVTGAARGRVNEHVASVAIPAYVSAETLKLSLLAEATRLDKTDTSVYERASTDYLEPTVAVHNLAFEALTALRFMEQFISTDWSDLDNAKDGCLYKDAETPWIVDGKTMWNKSTEGRDATVVFCKIFNYGDLVSTELDSKWIENGMFNGGYTHNIFPSELTEGTKIVHQSVNNKYQFAVRVGDNLNPYVLMQEDNKEWAQIVRNFHTLTKNTDTLGNLEEVILGWTDIVIAYSDKFGPNAPGNSDNDAYDGRDMALEALQIATRLGVDQEVLTKRAMDADNMIVPYGNWYESMSSSTWGNHDNKTGSLRTYTILTRSTENSQCNNHQVVHYTLVRCVKPQWTFPKFVK
ncbi:hypothetical protein [Qipengyuania sphaerica]|uniref:hypothetical protein n=1 Tax=Qipengyuania sphaerica TaxID=2867243 RepID=UPI001C877438|nr:hypothetical protein [Qipengyuania sphaerica]MBX7540391.1 hypothetical protein [Qipengyuania sphaerica]